MVAFRTRLDNPEYFSHLKILFSITSAKTLFPQKVTFTGSRGLDLDIFWGAISHSTTESGQFLYSFNHSFTQHTIIEHLLMTTAGCGKCTVSKTEPTWSLRIRRGDRR